MNHSDRLAFRFASLFSGRKDAYGTNDGGCVRTLDRDDYEHRVRAHLEGNAPLGVYPVWWHVDETFPPDGLVHMDWCVKWGCSDLDLRSERKPSGDYDTPEAAHVAARNLQAAHDALGIVAHIERSRSGGFHVWVFAAGWVPASTMRRALLVVHDVAGVRPTEVFPKQEQLGAGCIECGMDAGEHRVAGGSSGGRGVLHGSPSSRPIKAPRGSDQAGDDGQRRGGEGSPHSGSSRELPSQGHAGLLREQELESAVGVGGAAERSGLRPDGGGVSVPRRSSPGEDSRVSRGLEGERGGVRQAHAFRCSVGNFVRLPYPRSLNTDGVVLPLQSQVMLDEEGIPRPLTGWLVAAEQNLAAAETLSNAADLWVQPDASSVGVGEIPELTREITDKLSPRTYFVLANGPLGTQVDRSGWLYRLAAMCADDGLSPDEAVAVVAEADDRYTKKYVGRRDGERWLRRTVERAFAGAR